MHSQKLLYGSECVNGLYAKSKKPNKPAALWIPEPHPRCLDELFRCLPLKPRVFRRLSGKAKQKGFSATFESAKLSHDFIGYDGIDLNHSFQVRFVSFDCDHEDLFAWRDAGLPTPLMAVRNRKNGRYHVTWELAEPVLTGPRAKKPPQNMLRLLRRAIAIEIGADLSYSMVHTKNPWNTEKFEIVWFGGEPAAMSELADQVDMEAAKHGGERFGLALDQQDDSSRNKAIFNAVRHRAYGLVRDYRPTGNYDGFAAEILTLTRETNTSLDAPLPDYEAKAIAKSITRFCWERYSADSKGGSVRLFLKPGMTTHEKQSAAGKWAVQQNAAKKRRAVAEAMRRVMSQGKEPTRKGIAAVTGLSKNTVKSHWDAALEVAAGVATEAADEWCRFVNVDGDDIEIPAFLIA
ncbi:replication initiation protein [Novispirillum sp. DQ9]|uniref:replication initiation protein n=1 Tax=Novispirillum sp. DQ9 TaxID=3398612 RepID=UPI003C7B7643